MTSGRPQLGIEEARAKLGDLVIRAQIAGTVTIITRHGRPAAAVVPLELVPDEDDEGGDTAT